MELHTINTIYVALPMCTNRKNDIFMQRRLTKLYIYIGVGVRDLYIDEAHMALDIFRFAVFF